MSVCIHGQWVLVLFKQVHFESARTAVCVCEHLTITYKNARLKRTAWPKTLRSQRDRRKKSKIDGVLISIYALQSWKKSALFLHNVNGSSVCINGIHSQPNASKDALHFRAFHDTQIPPYLQAVVHGVCSAQLMIAHIWCEGYFFQLYNIF